jgi:hypothetical protein
MFQTVGYRVKRLLRVRVGNLRLGDLPCGHWRALTQRELKDLDLMNTSDALVAGVDRGRQEAGHVSKARSTPSATTSNETRRL